jgi:hypothetical protein
MRLLILIGLFTFLSVPSLRAQDPDGFSCMRSYFRKQKMEFFIPSLSNVQYFQSSFLVSKHQPSIVYESPVQHHAFFCRMEDLSIKKFGIMIQVHAGDYNSYMDYKIPVVSQFE